MVVSLGNIECKCLVCLKSLKCDHSTECSRSQGFVCLSNLVNGDQNRSCFTRKRFPALCVGYVYFNTSSSDLFITIVLRFNSFASSLIDRGT